MFLKNWIARRPRDDGGLAMIAVISLMAIGVLLTALIAGSVISGLGQTTSTRAGVQAQASAEAGIAAALVGLQTAGSCAANAGVYTSSTAPIYRATVWYGSGTWTKGCPSGSGQVRIISTGTAASPGVAGNKSGDVAYVEAVYAIGGSTASGSAIYIAGSTSLTNFSVLTGTATLGSVKLPTGNFSCDNNAVIQGDVIVAAGNATLSNACIIQGSLKVSGSVTLSNTVQILGDVVAAGGGVTMNNSGVYVKGNIYSNGFFTLHGTVDGNVEATGGANVWSDGLAKGSLQLNGDFYTQGTVNGSVTATGAANVDGSGRVKGSLTAGGTVTNIGGLVDGNVTAAGTGQTTVVPGSLRVGGNLTIGGDLNTWNIDYNKPTSSSTNNEKFAYGIKANGWVTGTVAYRQTGLGIPTAPVAKAAPTVSTWVDWSYKWSDWQAAGFVEEFVWPAALGCQINNRNAVTPSEPLYPYIQKLFNLDKNTVVNTFGCATFEFCNCVPINLKFKADVAFVGNRFVLGAVKLDSFDSADRKAWFLVPDGAPSTAGRQCTAPSSGVEMYGNSIVGSHLSATIYTPCNIQLVNQSHWRGQLYGGSMSMSSGDDLTYVPVGIPGTDLDGGVGGATPSGLGGLVSYRNVSGNGE